MKVRPLEAADDPELCGFLDRLAASEEGVLAYHYPFYRELLHDIGVGEPLCLGAWEDGRLVAALPGFVHRSEIGSVYSSLPFFGPNAGVLCAAGERQAELHQALLGGLLARLESEPELLSLSVYTPLGFDRFELYEQLLPGATHVERRTQLMRLDPPRFPRKVRYDIRRAEREGVSVSSRPDPDQRDEVWLLYRQSCEARGIPLKPRAVFDALAAEAEREGRARLHVALHGGRVVAALLTLRSPAVVSYYLPCTLDDARALQPSSLLVAHAARDAAAAGIRLWNWEASPAANPGVWHFKQRWGAEPSAYRIYVLPRVPLDRLRGLGAERLAAAHPWFFVYPFDRL